MAYLMPTFCFIDDSTLMVLDFKGIVINEVDFSFFKTPLLLLIFGGNGKIDVDF